MLSDSQTPFASFDRRNGVFDVQVEGTVWAKQPECCVPKDLDAGRQGVTAFVECILGRQPPAPPAPPPPPGCLYMAACQTGSAEMEQRWVFADGGLSPAGNAAVCAESTVGGDELWPHVVLRPCEKQRPSQRWGFNSSSGAIVQPGSEKVCFDIREANGAFASAGSVDGFAPCSPTENRNEVWHKQGQHIVSNFSCSEHDKCTAGNWTGTCLTVRAE